MKTLALTDWQKLWLAYAAYRQRIESEKAQVKLARVMTIYEFRAYKGQPK